MHGFGERIVTEGLLHVDGLAGLDELVDVGGHLGLRRRLALDVGECQA